MENTIKLFLELSANIRLIYKEQLW